MFEGQLIVLTLIVCPTNYEISFAEDEIQFFVPQELQNFIQSVAIAEPERSEAKQGEANNFSRSSRFTQKCNNIQFCRE